MFLKLAFDFSLPEIRHAWRIGIIAITCYLLSLFVFKLESPQWVMVTAMVCSQVNFGSTIKRSKQRLIGTVLGCGFALLTQYLFGEHPLILTIVFLLSFLVSLHFLVKSYTVYITFFTYAFILMMFFLPSVDYHIAFLRIEDAAIGILIGTIGSLVLWPDFASKMFKLDIVKSIGDTQELFTVITQWMNDEESLDSVMQKKYNSFNSNQFARNRITEIYHEFGLMRYPARKYEKLIISQERIHYTLLLIVQSARYIEELNKDENSLYFYAQKMKSIKNQYIDIILKIPNIKSKLPPLQPVVITPRLAVTPNPDINIDQKLLVYLEKLRFELAELTKVIDEVIKYEK